MSGTEYTPTMEQLRMAWIEKRWNSRGQLRSEGSDAEFDRAIAAHDAELTKRVRAEQRETDAQIGHDAAAQWVDEWQPNSHKNSHIEDCVAAAIREASDD